MKRQKLKFEKIEALAHEIKKLCEFEEALRNSYGVRSTIKFDNHTEAFELQEYAKYYIHQIVADKLKERREEFEIIKWIIRWYINCFTHCTVNVLCKNSHCLNMFINTKLCSCCCP